MKTLKQYLKEIKVKYHGTGSFLGYSVTPHGNDKYLITRDDIEAFILVCTKDGYVMQHGKEEEIDEFFKVYRSLQLKDNLSNKLEDKNNKESKRVKI